MKSQKRSYEQRQASKKLFMQVTMFVVAGAMIIGVLGSVGVSSLIGG